MIDKYDAREMLQKFLEDLISKGEDIPKHEVIVFRGKINDNEIVQYNWRYLLKVAYELEDIK